VVQPHRLAAVDIGSNTVHALVADVDADGRLQEVGHYLEMPELGARVDRTGRIGPTGTALVLEALDSVISQARGPGFEYLVAGATAAVRKAPDGPELLAAASSLLGTQVYLISGEREAQLSFLGVASAHSVPDEWVMADLGGSSTEVVAARGDRIVRWASLQVGSGGLAARYLSDPPVPGERQALREDARAGLAGAPPSSATRLVVTGGTAANLPLVLSEDDPPTRLGADELARAQKVLDSARVAELAEEHDISASRLRALRGGVEVLRLLLERYRVPAFDVSLEGLRHGMILAYEAHGDAWPEVEPLGVL
jgi:exopolyphosphatase/guanosine-5'-triphosphate,3'-diphosphate pyrophosphatase